MAFSSTIKQYLSSFAQALPNGMSADAYIYLVNALSNSPLLLQQLENAVAGPAENRRVKGFKVETGNSGGKAAQLPPAIKRLAFSWTQAESQQDLLLPNDLLYWLGTRLATQSMRQSCKMRGQTLLQG